MPRYQETRRRYTAAQTRAYHSGQGYRLGEEQRAIEFRNPANKQSFANGDKSVDPSRYGPNRRAQQAEKNKKGGK